MARTTIRFSKYLAEQIANRYAIFDRQNDGKSNLVYDSYIPKLVVDKLLGNTLNKIPQTAYCISDFLSEEYGVRQLPFEMLIEILGFNKKEINRLLIDVKKQKLNMVFAGFGGTGTSTMHWLSKMLDWTGQVNLFQHVAVYDDDKTSIDNLLRIPFNTKSSQSNGMYGQYKIGMASNKSRVSANDFHTRREKLALDGSASTAKEMFDTIFNDKHKIVGVVPKENTFIYGAPDLESRDKFKDVKFLSATHGDDECSLIIKPLIDTSIQVESYGLIRLTSFFMNQLRMAIALLEFLAANDDKKWDTPAEEIFTFNFKEYIEAGNGEVKGKSLNWQMEHDGFRTIIEEGV